MLTEIFDLVLNVRPRCVSNMKSLGFLCHVCAMIYPYKLNSVVNAKVLSSCIVSMMTVNGGCSLVISNFVAMPSYKTS